MSEIPPVDAVKVWLFSENEDGTLSPADISGGGGGGISGTIAANQLVVGTDTNTIGPITDSGTTWQINQDGPIILSCWGDSGCGFEVSDNADASGDFSGIFPNVWNITDGTTHFTFNVNSGELYLGSLNASIDPNGVLGITQLRDITGGNFVGECAMDTGTTCTFSLNAAISGALCFVTAQGTDVTGGAAACSVSDTTVTITATVANSNTWAALIVGT